jgi:hypothetical protein
MPVKNPHPTWLPEGEKRKREKRKENGFRVSIDAKAGSLLQMTLSHRKAICCSKTA